MGNGSNRYWRISEASLRTSSVGSGPTLRAAVHTVKSLLPPKS